MLNPAAPQAARDQLVDLVWLAVSAAQRLYTMPQVAALAQGFYNLPAMKGMGYESDRSDWWRKLLAVKYDKRAALEVLGAWALSLNIPAGGVHELDSFWIRAASA